MKTYLIAYTYCKIDGSSPISTNKRVRAESESDAKSQIELSLSSKGLKVKEWRSTRVVQ